MNREQQRLQIRRWVLVNYLSCLIIILLPVVARLIDLKWLWISFYGLILALFFLSMSRAFWKTGLWKLTHKKTDKLDEREIAIAHSALGKSYQFMTVVFLIVMYLLILGNDPDVSFLFSWINPIAPILAFMLIYIVHTMPAAIIGWRELPVEE
jgi:phosphatidylglycerophosphate synthase